MLDWLQSYGGVAVAIIAILGSLWGLAEKLEKYLEKHQPLRQWVADGLMMPSWYDRYRDWLGRQLERLQSWMGGLLSGRAFSRCLAIAFTYPVALMLVGYGFGGPGTIGTTEFLPTLGEWRQPLLGFGLITVVGVILPIVMCHRNIDLRWQLLIAEALHRRHFSDPAQKTIRIYKMISVIVVVAIWYLMIYYRLYGEVTDRFEIIFSSVLLLIVPLASATQGYLTLSCVALSITGPLITIQRHLLQQVPLFTVLFVLLYSSCFLRIIYSSGQISPTFITQLTLLLFIFISWLGNLLNFS